MADDRRVMAKDVLASLCKCNTEREEIRSQRPESANGNDNDNDNDNARTKRRYGL